MSNKQCNNNSVINTQNTTIKNVLEQINDSMDLVEKDFPAAVITSQKLNDVFRRRVVVEHLGT